jgi:hypothetical protein
MPLGVIAAGVAVEQAAAVHVALARLAQVGEIKAAVRVEHDVVGTAQGAAFDRVVQPLGPAGGQVDAFDATARVVVGLAHGAQAPVGLGVPAEAAVVAHVHRAVGPDGRAVGPAAQVRHHLHQPVGAHAREGAAGNFHKQHGAVVHGDGAFGKLQAGGEFADAHRVSSSVGMEGRGASLLLQA